MNRNLMIGGGIALGVILLVIAIWAMSGKKVQAFAENNIEIESLAAGTFREYSLAPKAKSPKAFSVPLGLNLNYTVEQGTLSIVDLTKDEELDPKSLPDPFFFANKGSADLKFRIAVVREEKPNHATSKMIQPIEIGVAKTIRVAPNGKTGWYLPASLQILEIDGVIIQDEAGVMAQAKKGDLLKLPKNWQLRAMNAGGYVSLIGK